MKQQEIIYPSDIHINTAFQKPFPIFGAATDIFGNHAERPSMSKEEFLAELGDDTLFRWVHVPYSMIEVVWDYLDSCCCISSAKLSRMPEVKKEIRDLKELKKAVDYQHKSYLSKAGCPWNEDDAISMQDSFKGTFSFLSETLSALLDQQYSFPTEADSNRKIFWVCSYIAYVTCKAIIRYGQVFRQKFYQQYRIEIRDIICREFYDATKLFQNVIEKKPLKFEEGNGCAEWIADFVDSMFDVQFIAAGDQILERKLI